MSNFSRRGFTIIEVMLFLAITGLLIAVLLGGWTVMINTQRYRDSVDTLYTYLQDQYGLVYNVERGNETPLTCSGGAIVAAGPSSASRGQSDCVLMGRYVLLTKGTELKSYAIIGSPSASAAGSDADVIRLYNPQIVDENIGLTQTALQVPWQAKTTSKDLGESIAFIIIRAPVSGSVHTYIVKSTALTPVINGADISSSNEREVTLCVDPGAAIQGGQRVVIVRAFASSANSIETLEDNSKC